MQCCRYTAIARSGQSSVLRLTARASTAVAFSGVVSVTGTLGADEPDADRNFAWPAMWKACISQR